VFGFFELKVVFIKQAGVLKGVRNVGQVTPAEL
jgi:hypothetical protein